MKRILIAGCGYVGSALGEDLVRRGDEVIALRRRTGRLPPGLIPLPADLLDPGSLEAIPQPLDAVVYAAAPERGDQEAYAAVYGQGLANLLATLARRAGATASPPFVLLSSTSVYGQTGGEWVDESSPAEPLDFRGRLVLRGEAALAAAGLPGAIVLRLGGLYGPGRTSLIEAVRSGRARLAPAGSPRFTNRIHRDDAARAIRHLLDLPEDALRAARPGNAAATPVPPAATFLGVDEEPSPRDEVLRFLARRLGVDLAAAAPAATTAGQPESGPAGRVETSKRCSSAKLRATGFRFRYPTFREGYAALLETAETAVRTPPIANLPPLVK